MKQFFIALISIFSFTITQSNAQTINRTDKDVPSAIPNSALTDTVAGNAFTTLNQARSALISPKISSITIYDRDSSKWTMVNCSNLLVSQNNYSWFKGATGQCWRLTSKPVTFSMFGASGASNSDQTTILQRAIDYAAIGGIPIHENRNAYYLATQISLPSGLELHGTQTSKTIIRHIAGTMSPLVVIPAGPVSLDISDIQFIGNGLPYEHGLYFHAKADDSGTGGLWYSRFSRVQITGFGGKGLWERGGTGNNYKYLLPNQFNTYDEVVVTRTKQPGSRALSLTGQTGQHYFVGASQFDGPSAYARGLPSERGGTNVVFSAEYLGGTDPLGAGDAGDALDNNGVLKAGWTLAGIRGRPTLIDFRATSQNSDRGIVLDGAGQVSISHSWFENINRAVSAFNSSNVAVVFSHFANATSDGTPVGGGWGVLNADSFLRYGGNDIVGAVDKIYASKNPRGNTRVAGDMMEESSSDLSSGLTAQIVPYANTLSIGGNETLLVKGGALTPATISKIVSSHNFGTLITILAYQGVLRIVSSNYIATPGSKTMLIRPDDALTLRKVDIGSNWQVVGTAISPLTSDSIPSSGYFEAGEFVRNTSSLAAGTAVFGWYRLTTGSGQVAGTDWRTLRVTGA